MSRRVRRLGPHEILLSLYASMPVLAVTLAGRYLPGGEAIPAGMLLPGVAAWLVEWTLLAGLFTFSRPQSALLAGACLLVLRISRALALGTAVSSIYLRRLLPLEVYPTLAVGLRLIYLHVSRRTLEKAIWPIDLAAVLLASHAALLLAVDIQGIASGGSVAQELPYLLYEAASFLPVVLHLRILRLGARKRLEISPRRIAFRGADIAAFFPPIQRAILRLLAAAGARTVTCREVSAACYPRGAGGRRCAEGEPCKPSVCARYLAIYRAMSDIRKKIENLGIGTIVAPENKREIRDQGWGLRLSGGVTMEAEGATEEGAADPASDTVPRDADASGRARRIRSAASALLGLPAAGAIALDLAGAAARGHVPLLALSAVAMAAAGCLPLLARSRPRYLGAFLAAAICCQVGTLLAARAEPQSTVLFLFLRNLAIFQVLLILALRHCELGLPTVQTRATPGTGYFWILWFYLAALLLFREDRLGPSLDSIRGVALYAFDRGLFVFLCLAVLEHLLRKPRRLRVEEGKLCVNGRPVDLSISAPNLALLRAFLRASDRNLTCREIVPEFWPAEEEKCGGECKASACPAYQRLYKRVQEVRKVLEALDLGTVTAPTRAPDAREQGWKLRLAEAVYAEALERPSIPPPEPGIVRKHVV